MLRLYSQSYPACLLIVEWHPSVRWAGKSMSSAVPPETRSKAEFNGRRTGLELGRTAVFQNSVGNWIYDDNLSSV